MIVTYEKEKFEVLENGKIKNVLTGGYIRKADKVANIQGIARRMEREKASRLALKEVEKPVYSPKLNDSIESQVVYEFLVMNKEPKLLEKQVHINSHEVLEKHGLSEIHQGNFQYAKKGTIIKTLKRYGKHALANLFELKFYPKSNLNRYGL